jgi:hypothetical protein
MKWAVACPSEQLDAYAISRRVNNIRGNEGRELLKPAV